MDGISVESRGTNLTLSRFDDFLYLAFEVAQSPVSGVVTKLLEFFFLEDTHWEVWAAFASVGVHLCAEEERYYFKC